MHFSDFVLVQQADMSEQLRLHWHIISRTFSGRLWRGQRLHCWLSEEEARVSIFQSSLRMSSFCLKTHKAWNGDFSHQCGGWERWWKDGAVAKGLTFMDKWGWRRVETRLEMKRLNILTHQSLETQTHQSLETQTHQSPETQTHQSSLLKDKRGQRIFWLTSVSSGKTTECQRLRSKGLWPDFRDSDKGFQSMGTLWKGLKVRK